MAYNEKQWLDARGYYEAGLSLSQIQEKTGIARSSVSKKAKSEQWKHGENTDYIEAKELIEVKKSTKNQHLLNIADEVAYDNIRRKKLIYGAQEKAVERISELLESNKKTVMLKTPQFGEKGYKISA